jgi:hypothetical protein
MLLDSGKARLTAWDNVVMTGADSLADLQQELRYLLNRWDPIGVYDESLDFPPDEYDCLIGPLLVRLARCDSRADLSQYLWDEIEEHFGLDPVLCGTDHFADRLLAWYAARHQDYR